MLNILSGLHHSCICLPPCALKWGHNTTQCCVIKEFETHTLSVSWISSTSSRSVNWRAEPLFLLSCSCSSWDMMNDVVVLMNPCAIQQSHSFARQAQKMHKKIKFEYLGQILRQKIIFFELSETFAYFVVHYWCCAWDVAHALVQQHTCISPSFLSLLFIYCVVLQMHSQKRKMYNTEWK